MISSTRRVRKRDGREVPFEQGKIADAIFRAARSVGGGDRFLAEELASVVSLFIDKEWSDRVPSIDDVSDLIEKVLVETGHGGTAKAFILERDRRARIRSALRVRRDQGSGAADQVPTVNAHTHATVSPWSKGKIVEALIVEADVPSAMAEEIAGEVERRVFASGLTRISTSLVRELVDNELFERGYERVLDRQTTIGLPRYDLDRLARTGIEGDSAPGCADAVDRCVAQNAWTQYSLLAVYPPEVVQAHLSGRIHVGSLGSPTRFEALEAAIDADLARAEALAANSDGAALRLFARRAAELADQKVTVRGVERLLVQVLAADNSDAATEARSLLLALGTPAELPAERPTPVLRFPSCASATWIDSMRAAGVDLATAAVRYRELLISLCREAAVLVDGPSAVRPPALLLDLGATTDEDVELLEAAVMAEAAGLLSFCVEPLLGGTLGPFSPLLLRVDVNVAQVAFRTRRFETRAVVSQLEEAVALAADACDARARYMNGLPGQSSPRERLRRLAPKGVAVNVTGRYEIGLAGLDAACRVAFDHGPWRDERSREFALAVVSGVKRAVAEEAKRRRLPMATTFATDPSVLSRFGRIDFDRHPRGRDVHGVPHDGSRYLYPSTLSFGDGDPDAARAAELEVLLRLDTVPSALPVYHSLARDRIAFLRHYCDRLRGTEPGCD